MSAAQIAEAQKLARDDVRNDPIIAEEITEFLREHGARTVAMTGELSAVRTKKGSTIPKARLAGMSILGRARPLERDVSHAMSGPSDKCFSVRWRVEVLESGKLLALQREPESQKRSRRREVPPSGSGTVIRVIS